MVALQLAGLQVQVLWGDYDPALSTRYDEIEQYLHQRIIADNPTKTREDWKKAIAAAHKVEVCVCVCVCVCECVCAFCIILKGI